jgi:hypothetical protein
MGGRTVGNLMESGCPVSHADFFTKKPVFCKTGFGLFIYSNSIQSALVLIGYCFSIAGGAYV